MKTVKMKAENTAELMKDYAKILIRQGYPNVRAIILPTDYGRKDPMVGIGGKIIKLPLLEEGEGEAFEKELENALIAEGFKKGELALEYDQFSHIFIMNG